VFAPPVALFKRCSKLCQFIWWQSPCLAGCGGAPFSGNAVGLALCSGGRCGDSASLVSVECIGYSTG